MVSGLMARIGVRQSVSPLVLMSISVEKVLSVNPVPFVTPSYNREHDRL